MNDNWNIFEANCLDVNAKYLWKLFTGNDNGAGNMNFTQFMVFMKKVNAEKFKYRDSTNSLNGRIYPKFMSDDDYNNIYKTYSKTMF